MTTIAYKDGVLVADTQVTEGNWTLGTVVKVRRIGRVLAGYAGGLSAGQRFLEWVAEGLAGDCPMEEGNEGFVIEPDGRITVWNSEYGIAMGHGKYYSCGSGRPFAVGAMAAGASAQEAVLIAATHDIYTNDKLTVLHL